ncbi:MAG: hypothetical protein QX196_07725, partial [Methylococcaceae bacterium]
NYGRKPDACYGLTVGKDRYLISWSVAKSAGQAIKDALAPTAPLRYTIRLGGRSPSMGELRG